MVSEMEDNVIIVTRHSGMVEWLERKGIKGEVLKRASRSDIEGMQVYGRLPMHLAALTESYTTISIPNISERLNAAERDLTADEMEVSGAYMESYIVYKILRVT